MSERHVTFYEAGTGRITTRQRLSPGEPVPQRRGELWCEGRFDASCFRIDPASGQAVELCEAEVAVTGNRIEGVPAGAQVSIRGLVFEADGRAIEVLAAVEQRARLRVQHPLCLFTERKIALDPAANNPGASDAQVVTAVQDPVRMRLGVYPSDGDQIDAFAKALDALIEAAPAQVRRDARVQEAAAIIARRKEVKAKLPKPEGKT
jgi:hypothetical protein